MKFNGIECSEKVDMTVDLSVMAVFIMLTSIRDYIFLHYLHLGTKPLKACYFVSDGCKKSRCFLRKPWLNSIFLQILKLNSLALLINDLMLYDVFNDLHLILNKLKWWFVFLLCFFSIWVFFHEHSRSTGLQGKGEGTSLTPHYYFHPLHRHLDISQAITIESSPLHIAISRTRTGNLWFPSGDTFIRWYVYNDYTFFYLNLLTLIKLSQSTKLFSWKWFNLQSWS